MTQNELEGLIEDIRTCPMGRCENCDNRFDEIKDAFDTLRKQLHDAHLGCEQESTITNDYEGKL